MKVTVTNPTRWVLTLLTCLTILLGSYGETLANVGSITSAYSVMYSECPMQPCNECLPGGSAFPCRPRPCITRACPPGHQLDAESCSCIRVETCEVRQCPTGYTFDQESCKCVCDKDRTCPTNWHWDQAHRKCVPNDPTCPAGYHWDARKHVCVSDQPCNTGCQCPAGYHFDPQTLRCVQDNPCQTGCHCPAGYRWDAQQLRCVRDNDGDGELSLDELAQSAALDGEIEELSEGAVISSDTVIFSGIVSSTRPEDKLLKMQIKVTRVVGNKKYSITKTSKAVKNGNEAKIKLKFKKEGKFIWKARVVAADGRKGDWISFEDPDQIDYVIDRSGPTAQSLEINSGLECTSNSIVNLKVVKPKDSATNLMKIRIGNGLDANSNGKIEESEVSFEDWQEIQDSQLEKDSSNKVIAINITGWTLLIGTGKRYVSVQLMDEAENVSKILTDSIDFSYDCPDPNQIVITKPTEGQIIESQTVHVEWIGSTPLYKIEIYTVSDENTHLNKQIILTTVSNQKMIDITSPDFVTGQVYHVRVGHLEPDSSVSIWSEPVHFQVNFGGNGGNGGCDVTPNIVDLLSPADGSLVLLGTNPVLSWSSAANAFAYIVQVFDNPGFTGLGLMANQQYGTFDTDTTVYGLGKGTYYWRIAGKSSCGNLGPWSETRTFIIDEESVVIGVPQLISPADDAQFGPTAVINFDWTGINNGEEYLIEISKQSDNFNILVYSDLTSNTDITKDISSFAQVGQTYIWRVKGRVGTIWSQYSSVRSFDIVSALLAQPTLIYPNNGQSILPDMKLSWNPVVGAVSYVVQIASDQNFTDIKYGNLQYTDTNPTVDEVNSLANGEYYWKVKALGAANSGIESDWSIVGHFTK